MSKQNKISEQIRKYLNGELDGLAMHQLEKEAQNDPFLMEALEGYEFTGGEQENNLADIHERLQDRIGKKESRIIPWRVIAIAASILILMGIGGLWLINDHNVIKPRVIARINKIQPALAVVKPLDTNVNTVKPIKKQAEYASLRKYKKAVVTEVIATSEGDGAPAAPTENSEVAEYAPLTGKTLKQPIPDSSNEVTVTAYRTQKRKDVTGSVSTITQDDIKDKAISRDKALIEKSTLPVTGIVKDETGAILPGATIIVKGTKLAAQTDANGKFSINNVPDNATLDVSFIGYSSAQVKAKNADPLVIAMQPSGNSLGEVAVVGYGTSKKVPITASPGIGNHAYKNYLKDNAKSPDGKTGTVKLSFIVNTNNSLSDFKIIKSVSAKTDSMAIELVKNGPAWYKNTNAKPQKVKLKIKFDAK